MRVAATSMTTADMAHLLPTHIHSKNFTYFLKKGRGTLRCAVSFLLEEAKRRSLHTLHKTAVRFFEIYRRDKKFEKMFSSKLLDRLAVLLMVISPVF